MKKRIRIPYPDEYHIPQMVESVPTVKKRPLRKWKNPEQKDHDWLWIVVIFLAIFIPFMYCMYKGRQQYLKELDQKAHEIVNTR